MSENKPVCIGGLPILPLTLHQWARYIIASARERKASGGIPAFFTSANGHILSLAARNPALMSILLSSDGIDADGQPLVFASRFLRTPIPERCGTSELMTALADVGQNEGVGFYFLGAHERENAMAVAELQGVYPKLKIVGHRNGYFSTSEEPAVLDAIRNAEPDILLVGMGAPLEQQFIARVRHKLVGVGAIKTCGGMMDVLAGLVPRPSPRIQKAGLEWLFRMCWDRRDSRRLIWRYATTNPHALYLLLTRTRQRWTPP